MFYHFDAGNKKPRWTSGENQAEAFVSFLL